MCFYGSAEKRGPAFKAAQASLQCNSNARMTSYCGCCHFNSTSELNGIKNLCVPVTDYNHSTHFLGNAIQYKILKCWDIRRYTDYLI